MGDAGGTGLGQAKETLLGRGWGGAGGHACLLLAAPC